jgi:hypothetical protein
MPERAVREPVDTLAEIDRWWDRWLKGIANGVEREPPVTIFVQGTEEWRHEREWPPARAGVRRLYPQSGAWLAEIPASDGTDEYDYDARVGLGALPYDACTGPIPYPQDQSVDDFLSLHYTTDPLPEALEVTGVPVVRLRFATDAALDEITLVAKLCDVAPDGRSFLVTFDHVAGVRAEPVAGFGDGNGYTVAIALRPTAHVFRAGHRLRLAISGGNFPYLWPSPRIHRLRLARGGGNGTELTLPIVPAQEPELRPPALAGPPDLTPRPRLARSERYWTHREDTGRAVGFEGRRINVVQVEPGSTLAIDQRFEMSVDADHPAHANTRTTATWRLERPVNAVEVRARTVTTLHDVHIEAEIDLDGFPYFRRRWQKSR